jgi:hypothetical protein
MELAPCDVLECTTCAPDVLPFHLQPDVDKTEMSRNKKASDVILFMFLSFHGRSAYW